MNSIHIIKDPRPPSFEDLETRGQKIHTDWFGALLAVPASFLFWITKDHFHFLIQAPLGPGLNHPGSQPSGYQDGLWQYDVAEFFLSDPLTGRYLEFNLAPNGAWWSCGFSSPRDASPGEPSPIPNVETHAKNGGDLWLAQAVLPLRWLQQQYHFDPDTKINATFILGSPRQIFLTAAAPGDHPPDFHRPAHFLKSEFIALA